MSTMIDMKNVKFVEVVPDDDVDDDDVVMGIEGEEGKEEEEVSSSLSQSEREQEQQQQQQEREQESTKVGMAAGLLSKSWTVGSAHVPTFTGGKVTHSYTTTNDNNDNDNHHPFLLLPVHGDLAIVDSLKGVKLGTVRRGCGNDNDENQNYNVNTDVTNGDVDLIDEEEDGVDQESITSYALDHKNQSIVTCSRNNMLQEYSISHSEGIIDEENDNDNDEEALSIKKKGKTTIKVVQTWGRSGHSLPVTVMSYHDSDIFVATGSVDSTVRIWDVRGRFVTHVFRPITTTDGNNSGRIGGISSIQWKPGTEQLIIAIGRDDGSISIHNLRDPLEEQLNRVVLLQDHLSAVTCMDWWSPPTSSTLNINDDSEEKNKSSEFFITTGRDSILNLWRIVVVDDDDDNDDNDTNDKKKKRKQKKKNKNNKNNKNNDNLQSSSQRQPRVIYRRIQTIAVYEQIEGMVVLPSSSVLVPPVQQQQNENEIRIVTAGSKGLLRSWKATVVIGQTPVLVDQSTIQSQQQQQPKIESFGENRGGYMGLRLIEQQSQQSFNLIAVDAEHNLSFIDYQTLTLNRTIVGHNDEVLDLKIIPQPSQSSSSTPTTLSTSVVVATNSPQVRVFDLDNFSCSVLDGHSATVLCVDASPCGRYLASCGKDKTLRVWMNMNTTNTSTVSSTNRYRCVGLATGHTEPIGACGLSQKVGRYEVGGKAARNGGGAFCVTASLDKTLKRWNFVGPDEWLSTEVEDDFDNYEGKVVELEAVLSVRGHDKDINIISVSPNDSLVASGSQDKTVKLWNSTDLSLKATLTGHRRGVWDCQFSPIDRVVATSSGDKTIKLWSLTDYSCVRTFQGHLSSVLRVRFLSTGLQLLSSGADGLLKLWTIRTNECETTLDGHSNKVWALDLAAHTQHNNNKSSSSSTGGGRNRGGDIVVSGAADSKILVWEDTTAQLEEEERAEEAERILLDQQMANHLRHKEYDKALDIALQVDKPRHALKVLNALLENEISSKKKKSQQESSSSSSTPTVSIVLQKHITSWDLDRIAQVLKYCREWNTRARNSSLAMWVLQAIVTTVSVDRLTSKDATETSHGSIPEIVTGITPYAERHFDRLDRLHANSYLLDYLLVNMDSFDPIVTTTTSNKDEHYDESEFALWESKSKLVLPPTFLDGRIQMGGKTIIGSGGRNNNKHISGDDDDDEDNDSDEVMTVGDSSSSSESEDDDSDRDSDDME